MVSDEEFGSLIAEVEVFRDSVLDMVVELRREMEKLRFEMEKLEDKLQRQGDRLDDYQRRLK